VALLLAILIIRQEIPLTALWLPVLIIPQLLFVLGAAWLIASFGVFLRDIAQGISLFMMAWMFLTPIIYPESIVPARYRLFINLNPLTPLIRNFRRVLIEGLAPDWAGLAYFSAFAIVSFFFGYWWFARTRKNFADVI
jgi:lipopolysaccharide transport system permease protein